MYMIASSGLCSVHPSERSFVCCVPPASVPPPSPPSASHVRDLTFTLIMSHNRSIEASIRQIQNSSAPASLSPTPDNQPAGQCRAARNQPGRVSTSTRDARRYHGSTPCQSGRRCRHLSRLGRQDWPRRVSCCSWLTIPARRSARGCFTSHLTTNARDSRRENSRTTRCRTTAESSFSSLRLISIHSRLIHRADCSTCQSEQPGGTHHCRCNSKFLQDFSQLLHHSPSP